MKTYTTTVTTYTENDVRVSRGLRLDQAILKVQRNIYGHDGNDDVLNVLILERASADRGFTVFCEMAIGQVNIKEES